MEESFFRELLDLLKQARAALPNDTQDSARGLLNEAIERVERALEEGSFPGVSPGELLGDVSRIISGSGQIAHLIDTVIKLL